ncbi:MAG: hypothetical protein HYU36_15100 [Planctomycetes bacterium]|nr:hypothetical protein [Planctomycetota bacterium]
MLTQIMGRRLTAESKDACVGSNLLYVAGMALFALGTFKVASLQVTESQLLLGLLATLCASMQMIVMGMLLSIRVRFQTTGENQR